MKAFFLLGLTFLSLTVSAVLLNSELEPSVNKPMNCEFYNILEEKFHCGNKGYPIGYGSKYCNKFVDKINSFLPNERKWIQDTLICLKKEAFKSYQIVSVLDSAKCDKILNWNFEAHPKCYIDNGFCELIKSHPFAFSLRLLKEVYEVKDMLTLRSIKQIKETLKGCFVSNNQSVESHEIELIFNL